MSDQVTLISFGLITALSWGLSDYFAASASKRHNPERTIFWVSLIGLIGYLIIFCLNPGESSWVLSGFLYALLAGMSLEIGLYLFYKALERGPVNIVAPISSAYPIVTTIFTVLVFGLVLPTIEVLGIIVVVSGIALAASGEEKLYKKNGHKGIYFSLATLLLWGLAYSFLGKAVAILGWQKALLLDVLTGFITLTALFAVKKSFKFSNLLEKSYLRDGKIFLAAALALLGGIIFTIGLEKTSSVPGLTAITAVYPIVTIVLAFKYLKESQRLKPIIGSIVTISGVIILALN